jgi:hypothetical protein
VSEHVWTRNADARRAKPRVPGSRMRAAMPGDGTGIVGLEVVDVPSHQKRIGRKELESEPDVNDDGEKFERVDVQAVCHKVKWFTG